MKKILLMLLAVFMFASIGSENTLAERRYDAYISFGDSFTRGLGIEGTSVSSWEAESTNPNIRIVNGAYNTIVGEEFLGIDQSNEAEKYYTSPTTDEVYTSDNYYPVAGYGLGVNDIIDIISEEPTGTSDVYRGIDVYGLYGKGGREGHIRDTIADAQNPIISFGIGLMDITMYSSADEDFQKEMFEVMQSSESDPESALLSIIPAYEKAMFKAYQKWAADYEKLLTDILDLRKDTEGVNPATIVLVGFFNPLREVNYEISLGEDKGSIYLPIGSFLDSIVVLMNETSRFLAKKYNDPDNALYVVYADAINGEGWAIENEATINDIFLVPDGFSLYIHGTASTYAYIGKQIINAIHDVNDDSKNYDISVDLIRYLETNANEGYIDCYGNTNIDPAIDIKLTVLLDGKKLNEDNYDLYGTVLTINGDGKACHKLLQVFINEYDMQDTEKELYTKVNVTKLSTQEFINAQKQGNIVKLTEGSKDVELKCGKVVVKESIDGLWVKAEPVKDGYGNILEVNAITVNEQVQSMQARNVAVRTYLLTWRDNNHYEAYSIDSTNSIEARANRIFSPITAPIEKAKADYEKWISDWYGHTDLGRFTNAVDDYKAAKQAINDADAAIDVAKDAVETAKANELFTRQALEKAIVTPSLTYTDDVKKAVETYQAAKDATQVAKDGVKDARVAAIQARKTAANEAEKAARKGVDLVKNTTKWAWDHITHLGH